MLLRKPSRKDYEKLYEMVVDPTILQYVRNKPTSLEHYLAIMDDFILLEQKGECLSRTIIVDNEPVGTITLFDMRNKEGFLATWLGVEHQGKGYNQLAKELFFQECYMVHDIDKIYMKIRKENIKSQRAAQKISYIQHACPGIFPSIYHMVNGEGDMFEVFFVNKDLFMDMMQTEKEEHFLGTIQYLLEHSLIEDIEYLLNKFNFSTKSIDFFKNYNYNV